MDDGRPDAAPRFRLPSAFAAVVSGVIGSGVVALLLAVVSAASAGSIPTIWRILLTTVLMALSEVAVLHLRFGGRDSYTLTWSETAVCLGLVLCPWPWISLASAAGVAIAMAGARRDVVKSAFNVGSAAAGTTLASLCLSAITHDASWQAGVAQYVGLAVVAVVYFAWNTLTVTAVISAVRRMSPRTILLDRWLLKVGVLVGNTVLALLLASIKWQVSEFVLVPFSVVLLYLAYRGYHRALADGEVWRELDAAVKEFMTLDAAGTASVAATHAVRLFHAECAEIAVEHERGRLARVYRHFSDGRSTATTEAWPPVADPDVPAPEEIELAAPHGDSFVTVGVLRIYLADGKPLPERVHNVLRTFTHAVATSLQNARLFSEMRYQAELNALEAARDPLTGIANRKVLHGETAKELLRAVANGEPMALLLVDLDNFKEINDTLGHYAGDVVLCRIAERFARCLDEDALVARLGGDEFGVLLRAGTGPESAAETARALLGTLAEPFDYEELRLAVTASVGIACYPDDGLTADDLFRRSDVAMYQAKATRNAVARYRSDRDDTSVTRITLAAELRNAIKERQFIVQFQPQVDLTDGMLVGAEALARWQHPTRGLLGPDEFMDLTERSGLIREFTLTVLDIAAGEAAAWHRAGHHIPVSVNLSVRNLIDPELPADVARILEHTGLPPELLVLEITETMMITEAQQAEIVLSNLHRLGVGLSVDDFGTGYSSMMFLQRVNVDEIKIDKSFVLAMLHSENDAAIVRATVDLAHGLGIRVVAEGVETAEHEATLQAFGCDTGQGWHFGRPGSAEQICALARRVPPPRPGQTRPRSLEKLHRATHRRDPVS